MYLYFHFLFTSIHFHVYEAPGYTYILESKSNKTQNFSTSTKPLSLNPLSDHANLPFALYYCNKIDSIKFSELKGTRFDFGEMTRRCSHCSLNGHNSRTCPNRGVKIFGVRLTDGLIRKSASMGNLTHYTGSNNATLRNGHESPGDTPDHGGAAADGYASEDFVAGSSSSRERKKGSILGT